MYIKICDGDKVVGEIVDSSHSPIVKIGDSEYWLCLTKQGATEAYGALLHSIVYGAIADIMATLTEYGFTKVTADDCPICND